jgi:hypothetical protein
MRVSVEAPGMKSLVAAKSRLLEEFSRRIAAAIVALEK